MRRKVWLEGDGYYLQPLPECLSNGDNVIQLEDGRYVLTSTEIDAAPDHAEANAIAARIITRLNAIGRINDLDFRPMRLNQYFDENGQNQIVGTCHVTLPRMRCGDASYPAGASNYLRLAEENPHVGRVLTIFAHNDDLDWYDLYKIHEIIRRDVEPQKLDGLGWTTASRDSAFTASANLYEVSGDAARHAVDKSTKPPKQTMALREGCRYIGDITAKWLDHLASRAPEHRG